MNFRWSILKVSLIIILSFSFLAIILGYLTYKNVNLLLGFWGKNSTLSVYLAPDILEAEKKNILEKLNSYSETEEVRFIDRTKAAADFKASLGEYANGLLTQDELIDLLPESFVISLKSSFSTSEQRTAFEKIANDVKSMTAVEEVTFGGEWIKKFSKLDQILRTAGLLLFCLLAICTAVISAFMVSSLVEESKQEIEVYSLVGATRWNVYKKFFHQIGYFHLISLLSAFILSALTFFAIKTYLLKGQGFLFIAESISYISSFEMICFFILLTSFIFLGAYLALKSSLRKLNLYAVEQ